MTALISHSFLQGYWWLIISLLAGFLLFLMFVQGGQSFIFSLPKNAIQKTLMVNTLGRKWEFTFTTLVTFGGAFFASFPLFYSVSFGGAYWLWMAILFSFILQAVAYEYRSKPANVYGTGIFDGFLFINGCLGPFLIGVAVATFFTGADFSLDMYNRVTWGSDWHGIEALANPVNLLLGLAVLFLARVLGLLYIVNTVEDDDLVKRAFKSVVVNAVLFLVFFLAFVAMLITLKGYHTDKVTGAITTQKYFYLHSLLGNVITLLLFVAGVVLVLAGLFMSIFRHSLNSIWYVGAGTVVTGVALFFLAGYGGSAFYPSVKDPGSSLTLAKSSSSLFTLKTMMFVSFIIPFVLAYIWVAWRAINKKRITAAEMSEGSHTY